MYNLLVKMYNLLEHKRNSFKELWLILVRIDNL